MSTDDPSIDQDIAKVSALIRSGRSAEALPLLDRIIPREPSFLLFALAERSRARSNTGDHVGAIADSSTIIQRFPDSTKGYTYRADVRARAGDFAGAIEDFTVAIGMDLKHPFALHSRGRLKIQIGDLIGAISDFTDCIDNSDFTGNENNSTNSPFGGYLNRGIAKHMQGDIAGAISDLTEAMKWDSISLIHAPYYLAQARMSSGDFYGAIVDFTTAIKSFPLLTNAYRLRAKALKLIGDSQGASNDQRKYQELGGKGPNIN